MSIQTTLSNQYPNARYSFDTNVYISIWRYHYPPDIFPAIYDELEKLIENGVILSTYAVRIELEKQHDDLFDYLDEFSDLFVKPTFDEQEYVTELVNHPELSRWGTGSSEKDYADPYVVALAKVHDLTVVTYETGTNPNTVGKACEILDVEICKFSEVLRNEGFSF